MRRVLAAVLAVTACGYHPERCRSTLGPVYSDAAIRCDVFEERIAAARAVVPLPGDYPIVIYPESSFPCAQSATGYCLGRFTHITGRIEVGNDAVALLHEMLHAWDVKFGVIRIPDHAGWDTNGYYDATRAYRLQFEGKVVTDASGD